MNNQARVLEAISESPLCDDCISQRATIRPRQTVNAVCRYLEKSGSMLSHDHDLGPGVLTGDDVAKWIVENGKWPKEIRLHSANPVGR